MVLPEPHPLVAAAASSGAQQNGAKKPVRKKVVSIQESEGHFPIYYTATSPHCAICLSEIEASEPCRQTTCKHEFHADCIMKWWTKERGKVLNCPTCREAQKVSVSKVRQVSIDARQKECKSAAPQWRRQSQPLRQRQEEMQGPLRRLLGSVRRALPKPLGTMSHGGRTTAAPSAPPSQDASQIPNDGAVQHQTPEDGTQTV